MAEELSGLNDKTLKNALDIRDTMSDLQSLASRLEKKLKGVGNNVSNASDSFKEIGNSANKVAGIQEDIKKSTKGVNKALVEQRKNLNLVKDR
jgi:methyl-accepting chemotaxis protein